MPALFLLLNGANYANNYAGISDAGLILINHNTIIIWIPITLHSL